MYDNNLGFPVESFFPVIRLLIPPLSQKILRSIMNVSYLLPTYKAILCFLQWLLGVFLIYLTDFFFSLYCHNSHSSSEAKISWNSWGVYFIYTVTVFVVFANCDSCLSLPATVRSMSLKVYWSIEPYRNSVLELVSNLFSMLQLNKILSFF